jgi:hypothetical protein
LQKDFTSIHFRDRITTKYARAKNNQKFIPQRSRRYSLLKPLDVVGLFGIKPIPRITPAKYKEEFSFLKEVNSLALANVHLQLEKPKTLWIV